MDYNQAHGLVAVGGSIGQVSLFPANPSLLAPNDVALVCLYNDKDYMNLLWSVTLGITESSVWQISISPNGEKLAVQITIKDGA